MVEITVVPKETWDTGFYATLIINNSSDINYSYDWKIQCLLPPNSIIDWMYGIYISNVVNDSIILNVQNYILPLKENTTIELDFKGSGDIPKIYNFIQGVDTPVVNPPPIPNPTFYPYVNMSLIQPSDDLIDLYSNIGLKTFNLAFIISNNSKPSWGTDSSLDVDSGVFDSLISNIKDNGGDVIISFGKPDSTDLLNDITNLNDLVDVYESVITRYNIDHISFNSNITDIDKINTRSQAIKILQDSNPELKVNLSLESTTNGFTDTMINIINSSITYGCKIYSYEIKYMNIIADTGLQEGYNIIMALKSAYKQLENLDISNFLISICCCIGRNNYESQLIFTNNDMFILTNYAYTTAFVNNISFWSINRDVDNYIYNDIYDESNSSIIQSNFDYSKIFLKL